MRCIHCGGTRRQVTLWSQIIWTSGGAVCCWAPDLPLPHHRSRQRGSTR